MKRVQEFGYWFLGETLERVPLPAETEFFTERHGMPEPGYNDGDAPPLWVWIIGMMVFIVLLILVRSCAG